MYKYINRPKVFTFYLAILSFVIWYTSCFIFIAVPFSNVNPGAFPEKVKSVQTTIKLIEPARYQLRCSCVHGSTSSTDPAGPLLGATCQNSIHDQQPLNRLLPFSFWTAQIETLIQTLTHLITMLGKVSRCGSDMNTKDWQDHVHLPHPLQPWLLLLVALSAMTFKRYLTYLFLTMISWCYFSHVNWFFPVTFLSWEPPWCNGTSKVSKAYSHFCLFILMHFGCIPSIHSVLQLNSFVIPYSLFYLKTLFYLTVNLTFNESVFLH